ncbi:MAG: secondary thiamine-phosphate synthase enzyme YjbQ [Candidatus Delongbacteria bacterium]|nr:secondary thiamine-phosphate synthase enzyme YjbQ [Candidatus Delongbacteria bacterium]
MILTQTLSIPTQQRTQWIDITPPVNQIIRDSGIINGNVILFVPHTTAAITINENADPSVVRDIDHHLNRMIPFDNHYTHQEGNSAAHIKSSLIGTQIVVLIQQGHLKLGTWQSIYFCEFDGPRTRQCHLQIAGDPA